MTKITTVIPTEIENHLLELHKIDADLEAAKFLMDYRQSELYLTVCNEKGDMLKPLYSTDKQRDAAHMILVAEDEAVAGLELQLNTLKYKRAKIIARIESLKMSFKLHLLDRELEIATAKIG